MPGDQAAGRRRGRALAALVGLIGSAALVALFGRAAATVNLAPLAATFVNGRPLSIHPAAGLTFASPDAVTDGLYDSQHMFDLPAGPSGRRQIELRWPVPIRVAQLAILGWGEQPPSTIRVEAIGPAEQRQLLYAGAWSARSSIPPSLQIAGPFRATGLSLAFEGEGPVLLNTVAAFTLAPRWLGWSWFLVLNLAGPWVIAAFTVLSILGWGRIAGGLVALPAPVLGSRLVAGLVLSVVVAGGWIALPRHSVLLAAWLLAGTGAAAFEITCRLRTRLGTTAAASEAPILPLLFFMPVLLLAVVCTDSYLLTDRRVNPLDHLISYLGAKRLATGTGMPAEMALRPWLVHGLYAPWDALLGRFSYYGYLGFMAGLNAFVLVSAYAWAERWRKGAGRAAAGLVALMPILVCFHFLGQRPLAAGLALLAVYWWTTAPMRPCWGGGAAAVAIGVHPSALFLLPGAALYFLLGVTRRDSPAPIAPPDHPQQRGARLRFVAERLLAAAKPLAVPVAAYAAWSLYIRYRFPGVRNPLYFYPVMLRWYEPPPAEQGLWEYLGTLSADHWRTLLLHRLGHLRHYLWTDDFSRLEPAVSWLRWIALPNVYGFVLTAGLLYRGVWRASGAFLWLALAAPLLLHHLHIGQAHPQLHISPTPFFALAALLAACFGPISDRLAKRVVMLAGAEWLLRLVAFVAPIWLAGDDLRRGPLEKLGFFAGDQWSYRLLGLLPLLVWSAGAWLVWHPSPQPEAGDATTTDDQAPTIDERLV